MNTISKEKKERGGKPPKTVPGDALKILLVDHHTYLRLGVIHALQREFPKAVFGEARNAQQALEKLNQEIWDAIILEIELPGRGGFDILREVKLWQPDVPVLIFTTHSEEQYGIRAFKSGAAGYVMKHCAAEELVEATKKVLTGGKYIRPSLAERLAFHMQHHTDKPAHETLSNREHAVLCMIAKGETVKEIAARLSLSIKTISTYRARILAKLHLVNNAQLLRYAIEHGLVELFAEV